MSRRVHSSDDGCSFCQKKKNSLNANPDYTEDEFKKCFADTEFWNNYARSTGRNQIAQSRLDPKISTNRKIFLLNEYKSFGK